MINHTRERERKRSGAWNKRERGRSRNAKERENSRVEGQWWESARISENEMLSSI